MGARAVARRQYSHRHTPLAWLTVERGGSGLAVAGGLRVADGPDRRFGGWLVASPGEGFDSSASLQARHDRYEGGMRNSAPSWIKLMGFSPLSRRREPAEQAR